MDRARATAWNIYMARVQAIVQAQHDQYGNGEWPKSLIIAPPTREHVEIVQAALDAAVREASLEIIHRALEPIVAAIDAIDNSRAKSPVLKDARQAIDRAYRELHALKQRHEVALAVGAVDPQAASTGTPTPRA